MKAVVICMMVLVASLCHQANCATVQGTTTDCKKEAEKYKTFCHSFSCDDESGQFSVLSCSPTAVTCLAGHIAEKGEQDLTKPYPDCCPRPYCRKA